MTNPRAILRACQVASGLSVPRYAEERLGRSARCVNYWLAGERDIPPRMVAFLERSDEYPQALEELAREAALESLAATMPPDPFAAERPYVLAQPISWNRARNGHCDSEDGRWHIEPLPLNATQRHYKLVDTTSQDPFVDYCPTMRECKRVARNILYNEALELLNVTPTEEPKP